ncbi:hypothetical protein HDV05_001243 [Chytridiales sp. JEL 0842]|nr:hypothetical protein HDV05_001243 [Chytridiales sp. JEL 0842]
METRKIMTYVVVNRDTGRQTPVTLTQAIMYLVRIEPQLAGLGAFIFLAGTVVLIFMAYQLSLVLRGTTTNEGFKWDDLNDELKSHPSNLIPKDLYDYNRTHTYNMYKKTPPNNAEKNLQEEDDTTDSKVRKRKGAKPKKQSKKGGTEGVRFVPSDDKNAEMVVIYSKKDLRNIYDRGWIGNLTEIFFPEPL